MEVDPEAGTYTETPLHAIVGFLEIEMSNRQRMAQVLAAAEHDDPSLTPLELAASFGWPTGKDEATTKLTIEEGAGSLAADDRVLVRWTASDHAIPEALRGAYMRFLHFHAHPHPTARVAMGTQPMLAAELQTDYRSLGQRTGYVLTLISAKPTSTLPQSTGKLRRVFGEGALADLARRVLQPGADDPAERRDRETFHALSADALERGDYEDAALLLLEYGLQSGEKPIEKMRALLSNEKSAPRIQALFSSFGGPDPEKTLRALDAVDRGHLTHPYILDIFRANALSHLGKRNEARDLLLATLKQAPWIAAAYKDLGDLYYRQFETGACWLCWEIGRSIAPGHSTWTNVNAYEKHLAKVFAEIL